MLSPRLLWNLYDSDDNTGGDLPGGGRGGNLTVGYWTSSAKKSSSQKVEKMNSLVSIKQHKSLAT